MTVDPYCDDPAAVALGGPNVEVTLSRPAPADPYVIGPDCPEVGGGVWFNRLELPAWSLRYTYAPPSAWQPGSVLLGAVQDASTLLLNVVVKGTSLADLEARKVALDAAVRQWRYTVTVTVGGVAVGSYTALPTVAAWSGSLSPRIASTLTAEAPLALPVQPPA